MSTTTTRDVDTAAIFDPGDPTWANRDRFVLSEGHASAPLWALLHLRGVGGAPQRHAGKPPYQRAGGGEATNALIWRYRAMKGKESEHGD